MSAKQAKKLRKALGMTKENMKQKELVEINRKNKVVYFKDNMGDLVQREAVRGQVINPNLNIYRKAKKQLKKGK